jgi:hypothetical protein
MRTTIGVGILIELAAALLKRDALVLGAGDDFSSSTRSSQTPRQVGQMSKATSGPPFLQRIWGKNGWERPATDAADFRNVS